MDSETSAILSYALGKHVEDGDNDLSSDADTPRASSTRLEDEEAEDFFKENDPLTSDYDPFPRKKVPATFSVNESTR
jgi:hypothetical protein